MENVNYKQTKTVGNKSFKNGNQLFCSVGSGILCLDMLSN